MDGDGTEYCYLLQEVTDLNGKHAPAQSKLVLAITRMPAGGNARPATRDSLSGNGACPAVGFWKAPSSKIGRISASATVAVNGSLSTPQFEACKAFLARIQQESQDRQQEREKALAPYR